MPRLHPGLAEVCRKQVDELTRVLKDDGLRDEAAQTLRSLIGEIRLIPEGWELAIELVGELGAMLALTNAKSPSVSTGARSTTLVAGARNHLELLFHTAA